MRKIILFTLFLILLIFASFISIKGTTELQLYDIYIEEGVGNDTYLYDDNYEVVSGQVDWNREGTYKVIYEDSLNNNYYKNVNVLPKKDNNYYIYKNKEVNIDVDKNNLIEDIYYISESSFYIISNYQMPDPTAPDQEKISVMYYENNQFKWEYRYYKFSRFVSASLYNENIIVIGLVYNENNYYINSIVLFEITKDRQIIKSREIVCDKPCFVYNLYIDNDIIYLITNTNGNKYDYEKYKKDEKSRLVILKVNYKTFQIIDGITNYEIDNYFIVDTSYYDRRLTINIMFKEKQGIFTNCIYEYNDKLEFQNKYYFSITNKDYIGHQVTGTEICFYSIDHSVNSNCVKIEYLHNNIENKNILLDLYNVYYINDIEVVSIDGNEIYFSLKQKTANKSYFLGYCKVSSFNGVTYFNTTVEENNVIKSKITNGQLINIYNENNKTYCKTLKLLEIQTIQSIDKNQNIKQKKLKANCKELNKYKYDITSNTNKFGLYKDIYIYTDKDYNIYYLEDTYEVKLNCNIENNNTYQKGYILSFNGEGILNGIEISNNFTLNNIGKYQLVIEGYNETEIIIFSIDELTITPIYTSPISFNINSVNIKTDSYNNEQYIDYKYEFITKDNSKEIVPIALTILCVGIIGFLFMRKKAWK